MRLMLTTIPAIALAAGVASIAHAQDTRVAPADRASLDRLAVDDAQTAPVDRSIALSRQFRLRVTNLDAAAVPSTPMRLHGRFATAMVDYFPVDGTGFHVSAGTRFHVRRNFAAEADKATHGLLYLPRGGGGGPRTGGLKRFTPTATAGYVGAIAPGTSLGIEAGARMGRAFSGMPRLGRSGGGSAIVGDHDHADRQQVNPMVNVVLGYRF